MVERFIKTLRRYIELVNRVALTFSTMCHNVDVILPAVLKIINFAELGKGNMLFLDGSPEGMQNTMHQIMGMVKMNTDKKTS